MTRFISAGGKQSDLDKLVSFIEHFGFSVERDAELVFDTKHFSLDGKLVLPDGLTPKTSTIRYGGKTTIRVPSMIRLPFYKKDERDRGLPPIGYGTITQVTIAQIHSLYQKELALQQYTNHKHAVERLSTYYPDISERSFVSLYQFKPLERSY